MPANPEQVMAKTTRKPKKATSESKPTKARRKSPPATKKAGFEHHAKQDSERIEHEKHHKELPKKFYEKKLAGLHIELVKLQEWIKEKGLKVVCVFEGRDAAGKDTMVFPALRSPSPRCG